MEGSVDVACDMARAAAEAGCWGFKVQLLRPETIATADAPLYWDGAATDQRASFTTAGLIDYDAWMPVKRTCDEWGLEFLATPFDLEAVDALERIGCRYVKIASGDITNVPLLRRVAESQRLEHVILSTGAATVPEIDRAIYLIGGADKLASLMACSLIYPTEDGDANLARIEALRFHFPGLCDRLGYSDHTQGTQAGLAAAALGASWLEKHYTAGGDPAVVPDHAMALDPDEMRRYVEGAQVGASFRGVADISPNRLEEAARYGARRRLVWTRTLNAGAVVQPGDVIALRPGPVEDVVGAEEYDGVIYSPITRGVKAGAPVLRSELCR